MVRRTLSWTRTNKNFSGKMAPKHFEGNTLQTLKKPNASDSSVDVVD
jgi:hypothetical protein